MLSLKILNLYFHFLYGMIQVSEVEKKLWLLKYSPNVITKIRFFRCILWTISCD